MEEMGCITCGSYENWEVQRLLKERDGKFTYEVKCLKCGRLIQWVTDNADEVPERARIREEFLTPANKFHPNIKWESDMSGFSVDKVKPRLPRQVGDV